MDPFIRDNKLLANIKAKLPELTELLEKSSSHWGYEDLIYRFYHQSFKVYRLQNRTLQIANALAACAPEGAVFCSLFDDLLKAGASGKEFEGSHNADWAAHTRPMVEAFFHAKYFLEMAVKYGKELETAPNSMPSGWAALLELYGIR